MASVRALTGAGTWGFSGDIKSYLLCCFSNPSSSSKPDKRKQQAQSETDVELTRHLTDAELASLPAGDPEALDKRTNDACDAETGVAPLVDGDDAVCAAAVDAVEVLERPECHQLPPFNVLSDHQSDVQEGLVVVDQIHSEAEEKINDTNDRGELLVNGVRGSARDSVLNDPDHSLTATNYEDTTTNTNSSSVVDGSTDLSKTTDISIPDSDERLFDVSDLQDASRCGRVHVTFDYSVKRQRLNVTIHEATEIPNQERGGSTNTQVRVTLLPNKKTRHKTKIIRSNENPKYDETFQIKLPKEELNRCGLRVRLYGCERLTRERMIGECVVRFVNLTLDRPISHWLTLEPRASLADSDRGSIGRRSRSSSATSGSSQSMDLEGFSELLLGLSYNAITGRLMVEVLQATNLKCLTTNRPPDTYVRVTLMSSSGKELTRSNTSVRKMSPNPVYREKFMFQVVESQLAEVSLMVSVYAKRSLKREELVGWFILGFNNSGEDEASHWSDMRSSPENSVERWHVLAEP